MLMVVPLSLSYNVSGNGSTYEDFETSLLYHLAVYSNLYNVRLVPGSLDRWPLSARVCILTFPIGRSPDR